MRVLPLALTCVLLFLGCGDAQSAGPPASIRSCGDLDHLSPYEPVTMGEDELGCPVFEPVPCTKPIEEYESVCGSGCLIATAAATNGDTWVVGCVAVEPVPFGQSCADSPSPPSCFVVPNSGQALWLIPENGCGTLGGAIAQQRCWEPCNSVAEFRIRDVCPQE